MGQSYHGPVLVATREEATLTLMMLHVNREKLAGNDAAAMLKAKCERVLTSDPKWREPTK